MKKTTVKSNGKFSAGLVVAWFAFALIASDLLWFKNDANRLSIAVAVAAATPVLAFSAWFAASEKFRKFAIVQPANSDIGVNLENCWLLFRSLRGSRSSSGYICVACGIR